MDDIKKMERTIVDFKKINIEKKSYRVSNVNDDNIKNHRISKIAISPKGTYVATYSKDDKSIFG